MMADKLDMDALFGPVGGGDGEGGGPDDEFRDLCKTIFPDDADGAKCEALFEAIQSAMGNKTPEPAGEKEPDTGGGY